MTWRGETKLEKLVEVSRDLNFVQEAKRSHKLSPSVFQREAELGKGYWAGGQEAKVLTPGLAGDGWLSWGEPSYPRSQFPQV